MFGIILFSIVSAVGIWNGNPTWGNNWSGAPVLSGCHWRVNEGVIRLRVDDGPGATVPMLPARGAYHDSDDRRGER